VSVLTGWKVCPRCSSALAQDDGHLRCDGCGSRYWANSVPGAQALLERDGRVLLGRRAQEPGAGKWDIPGGFLDEGEDALAGLRRELREETGLEAEPVEFLGIWIEPYWDRSVLCLTWLARPTGGRERAGSDLVELRWFAPDELPAPDELAFPTFVEILSLWAARHEHAQGARQ
jgi:ADP-ribose pyrophosphatase YjhB (NUDIX family)